MSVSLGNENTEAALLLRGLRLRFRGVPAVDVPFIRGSSPELPGQCLRVEKVDDPWYISMDGKKDVEVEGGAWSLTPGLGSNDAEWGRLEDGSGRGKFCLRFWVDVKTTVSKGDVGVPAGTRLFFAINVIDKSELPNLHAQIEALGKKIENFEK